MFQEPQEDNSVIGFILSNLLILGLTFFLLSLLMRKMGSTMGGLGQTSARAKAKVYMEKQTGVTFADVAGQDEAKESLQEIIDFLHNPQKYADIGAKLPKGALLVGPPGPGKTLPGQGRGRRSECTLLLHLRLRILRRCSWAWAPAGCGTCSSRPAKVAPCIIFIDEIDAVGRARRFPSWAVTVQQEQTLNQLLGEIDGFDSYQGHRGVPGRHQPARNTGQGPAACPAGFDRRVVVDRPNLQGRLDTLKVHTRKIRLVRRCGPARKLPRQLPVLWAQTWPTW